MKDYIAEDWEAEHYTDRAEITAESLAYHTKCALEAARELHTLAKSNRRDDWLDKLHGDMSSAHFDASRIIEAIQTTNLLLVAGR